MKSVQFCLIIAFFLVVSSARADEPRDGLYTISLEGEGQAVERVNHPSSQKVHLDQLLTTQLGEARLVSENNSNSRFRLSLYAAPFENPGDSASYVLVINGQVYGITSHSSAREDGWRRFGVRIQQEKQADALAKALEIQPERRTHPGHRTVVTVEQKQESDRVGDSVILVLKIKNVGEKAFSFTDGGMQRGARNNQFSFVGFDHQGKPMPDVGDPIHFGGMGAFIELEPGEVFEKEVDITRWFAFSEPGSYWITAMYQYDLLNGRKRISEGRAEIWSDFAVAQTRVVVRKSEEKTIKQ